MISRHRYPQPAEEPAPAGPEVEKHLAQAAEHLGHALQAATMARAARAIALIRRAVAAIEGSLRAARLIRERDEEPDSLI